MALLKRGNTWWCYFYLDGKRHQHSTGTSNRRQAELIADKLKQEANIPLYQPEREIEVLANAESNNSGPLADAAIRRLFERIIDEARAAERDAMHPDGASEKKGKK